MEPLVNFDIKWQVCTGPLLTYDTLVLPDCQSKQWLKIHAL